MQVLEGVSVVEIEDCGEGEAEEEIVCSASCELFGFEVRHFLEVGFAEKEGIVPVHSALVPANGFSAMQSF